MPQETLLQEVLRAREERAELQTKLIKDFGCPIVSFTMNIAGPIKNSPLIQRAFFIGLTLLWEQLDRKKLLFSHVNARAVVGPIAIFAIQDTAEHLKSCCTGIEEETAMGRLFDLDVIDPSLRKLSRKTERGCLICGRMGRYCAASRAHSVAELQEVTRAILENGVLESDCKKITTLAVQSLIDEVRTTPKPGLVDQNNNGSHPDMSPLLFEKSAASLAPYFTSCIKIGHSLSNATARELFFALRAAGLIAEDDMYRATGGINTHKGAVFSFGLLCGALGRLWSPEYPIAKEEKLVKTIQSLARVALTEDFSSSANTTAGEQIFQTLGITGIRGEAAAGFPAVFQSALPLYRRLCEEGYPSNDAGVITLLRLITLIDDTTLYRRGGTQGMEFAKAYANALLSKPSLPSLREVEEMDAAMITKNLSAGGAADLLALTYFADALSRESFLCNTPNAPMED